MGKPLFTQPPLFQSKLLCFSVLYLFSSLSVAIYFAFSATRCIFRSSPFDPLQGNLFSYPPSYGEHKHAIPITRSTCESPVFFSDYWGVVKEMQQMPENSIDLGAHTLRYVEKMGDSFGGNLSLQERLSAFKYGEDESKTEVPCGFFREFPISNSDRIAMESCRGVVVVSAVFGDHDKIRQPRGLGTKTLDLVCFFLFVDEATLRRLHFHNLISRKSKPLIKIGAWTVVRVSSERLYKNPAMNGVIAKYLTHRLFPNTKYSIWVDAKMQLVVDPLLLIHSLVVKENVDMAISRHPFFLHTMEEAMATARWKKWWDVDGMRNQMETYCENGLKPWNPNKPFPTDVPDSAVILRKHSSSSNLFSCLLFNELDSFNPRDQLAFAFVRDKMRPQIALNMFEVEVFEQVAVEYRHNLKLGGPIVGPWKRRWASNDLFGNSSCGNQYDGYLLEMWGESQ